MNINTTENLKDQLISLNVILKSGNKLNPRFKYILYNYPEILHKIVEVTCFLRYDAPVKARIQCIMQEITHQPTCKRCDDPCKMILTGSSYNNKFSEYCSRRCAGLDSKNLI